MRDSFLPSGLWIVLFWLPAETLSLKRPLVKGREEDKIMVRTPILLLFVSSTRCTAFLNPTATRLRRPVITHRSRIVALEKNGVDHLDSSFQSSLPSLDTVRKNIFEVSPTHDDTCFIVNEKPFSVSANFTNYSFDP
jgi:hypothetical protein